MEDSRRICLRRLSPSLALLPQKTMRFTVSTRQGESVAECIQVEQVPAEVSGAPRPPEDHGVR